MEEQDIDILNELIYCALQVYMYPVKINVNK